MTDQDSKNSEVDRSVERIEGQLYSVRSTSDDSGKILHQVLRPLMVEFRAQDVCEIAAGACVLAIPIAFTEEVWRLGEELPWANVIGIVIASIFTVALFVYFVFYKGHLRGNTLKFLSRTITSYLITVLVVVVILTLFQKCPWQSDPATAIRRVILVGFPACFSATVVDSLK